MKRSAKFLGMVMAIVAAGIGLRAYAAPLYWDGNGAGGGSGGDGQWDTATTANWNPSNDFSGAWGNWNQAGGQDIAVFSNTAGMVTLSGGVNANQMVFAVDGYTVTNGALTMTGAGLFDVAPNATATVWSGVAGTVALAKTNTGMLILAGTNAFSGVLTIKQGVVSMRTNTALGTTAGTIVSNGAALQVQGGISTGEPLTLNGMGIANDGAVRSLSGVTNILSGSTTVSSDTRINCDAGVLYANSQFSLNNNASLTIGGMGDTRIHKNFGFSSSLISGGNALIKDGPGRLTLSADNNSCSYTGATQVSEGSLQVGQTGVAGGNHLPVATTLILGNGTTSGTVDFWVGQTIGGLETSGTGTSNMLTSTSGATKVLTLNGQYADTFSGQIAGTLSLTKNYVGVLTLSGSNTYSGGTTVGNGATLALDCSADNNSKLGTGATTLQGATLTLVGNSAADSTQNLNNVTFNTGHSAITVTSGGGQSATLNLGTITRAAPGTVEFTLPASGSITTTTALANGSLGGYATIGSDWVTKSGIALVGMANYASFPAASTTTNELLIDSGSLASAKTLYSLKVDTGSAGQGLNLGANNLILSSRGLLFVGADPYTIEGTGSLGGSGNEMIIHAKGAGVLTINTPISGGAGSFVKTGSGTVVLGINNAYTGATTVNQGALRMGVAGAIGALSPVTVRFGATWDLNGLSQTVGALSGMGTISAGMASLTTTSAANSSFSGQILGSGGTFVKDGTGTLTFDGLTNNVFTGPMSVVGGTLSVNRIQTNTIAGDLTLGGGSGAAVVNIQSANQIVDTATVTVNRGGQFLLSQSVNETIGLLRNYGGYVYVPVTANLTVGGLEMTGGTNKMQNSTGARGVLALNGDVAVNASGETAWFLTDNGNGNVGQLNLNGTNRTFTVADGAVPVDLQVAALITSTAGGLIKTGAGHMRIGRDPAGTGGTAATYAGNTEVRDGTLSIGFANGLPTGRALGVGGSGGTSGVFDMNGFDQTVAGLSSTGDGAGNMITNSVGANVTFTINTTTSTVYAGSFGENAGGILSLVKSGTGTQELWGASTYTGTNNITAGVLAIGGSSALGQVGSFMPNKVWLNGGTLAAASNAVASLDANLGLGIGPTNGATAGTCRLGAIANGTLTINGTITSAGNTGVNTLTKSGAGLVALAGANDYTGVTTINGGALRLSHANALPGGIGVAASGNASGLTLAGGVLELGVGNFTRGLGGATNQVQITAPGGGFSASGAKRLANLGGAMGLVVWGSGSFVPTSSALILNSAFADSEIEFQNPINLAAATRTIQVDDNTAVNTDFATLSGVVTNGALVKTGTGRLVLAGTTNRFTGAGLIVSNGTLVVNGVTTGSVLNVAGGTALLNGPFTGPVTVGSAGALGGTGTVAAADLTLNAGARLMVTILAPSGATDALNVTGLLNLTNVTLEVINTNLLTYGATYRVLSCGSHTNRFAASNLPEDWVVDYRFADRIYIRSTRYPGSLIKLQ